MIHSGHVLSLLAKAQQCIPTGQTTVMCGTYAIDLSCYDCATPYSASQMVDTVFLDRMGVAMPFSTASI